jgi:hypothetical protein
MHLILVDIKNITFLFFPFPFLFFNLKKWQKNSKFRIFFLNPIFSNSFVSQGGENSPKEKH